MRKVCASDYEKGKRKERQMEGIQKVKQTGEKKH